ncbi:MAG: Maf family protein [Eudoraea sp.]|uniref:Maf family protein n=1 Tax=Eudoraea sp. TaxID=1979955 RepID=UPI003C77203B
MSILHPVPPFILASQSPRRRELLRNAGFNFDSISVDVDETIDPALPPLELVDSLALKKLNACTDYLNKCIVITADTLVFKRNQVLGKPTDRDEAIKMLQTLSNTSHVVTTSVCLGYQAQVYQFNVSTKVYFAALIDEVIEYYVDHYQPMDKAGAYGIQEWIGEIGISRIEGSYTNVVGLPLNETYQAIVEKSALWL